MTEPVEMDIRGFAFGGAAFGSLPDGKLCFVRGAAPGDRIALEIVSEKKNFATGRLCRILHASEKRITPECPLAFHAETPDQACVCPGCSYQHVPYDVELEWKQEQFSSFLTRSHLTSPEKILPPFASPRRYNWRNKIKLSLGADAAGNKVLGYFAEDNKTLVPVKQCLLARNAINAELEKLDLQNLDPEKTKSVFFRWTQENGVTRWNGSAAPKEHDLMERIGDFGQFQVPAGSFFQVNLGVASELVRRMTDALKRFEPKVLLELYCGVGVFSLVAAETLEKLTAFGVEVDPAAIESARRNAAHRNLSKRVRFHAGDASSYLNGFMPGHPAQDLFLLVDPPRTGLDSRLVSDLRKFRPATVLYISCAPDTLQRDLQKLCGGDSPAYEIVESGMLDLFPATSHFESMTLLRAIV